MESPQLESAVFNFSQDGNCLAGKDFTEFLEITCQNSLGIDRDDGKCFYILKTEGWSIDSTKDLQNLFDRIHKSIGL